MSLRGCALAIALLGAGCAQLFGIESTSNANTSQDAAPADAKSIDAAPIDALPCTGGDARATDPATGACYVLFTTPATRNAARASCATLGANVKLASIQSTNENTIISNLVGVRDAFLGGNDEAVEGAFVWEDGTAIQLTNWNTGEPNNGMLMLEEDCIVMRNIDTAGKWDDRPCAPGPVGTGSYAYVCERP
jgi:hypothetical protein